MYIRNSKLDLRDIRWFSERSNTRNYVGIMNLPCELVRRIHKRRFALGKFRLENQTVPELWMSLLAA